MGSTLQLVHWDLYKRSIFADDISKCSSMNAIFVIWIWVSLKLVHECQINNKAAFNQHVITWSIDNLVYLHIYALFDFDELKFNRTFYKDWLLLINMAYMYTYTYIDVPRRLNISGGKSLPSCYTQIQYRHCSILYIINCTWYITKKHAMLGSDVALF